MIQVENARSIFALEGVGDDLFDRDGGIVVEPVDGGVDRVRACDADADRHADCEPQLVGEHHVRRVGDRNEDGAIVEEADRQGAVASGEALRQHQRRLDLDRREVESTNSSSCCSARTREIAVGVTKPFSSRISPRR